jgi:hypothetical protein
MGYLPNIPKEITVRVITMNHTIRGRETISSLVTAIGLTTTHIPLTDPKCRFAIVQAIGGNIRFTLDGATDPVAATTGHILTQNSFIDLWGQELSNFKAINDGGSAKLEVTYYGEPS